MVSRKRKKNILKPILIISYNLYFFNVLKICRYTHIIIMFQKNNANKHIYEKIFLLMSKYNICDENIQKQYNKIFRIEPNCIKQENPTYPNDMDSLFWSLYIIINDKMKYEYNKSNRFSIEKLNKIEYAKKLPDYKILIKQYKISSMTDIESSLINDNTISLNTFIVLCIIEKINVIVVKNRTYYELFNNDTNNVYIILHNKTKNKYGFVETTTSEVNKFTDSCIQISKINKPLNSISFYKVQDLIDMCDKLNISIYDTTNGKKKKKDLLYNAIHLKII